MSRELFRPGQRVRSVIPTERSNGPVYGATGTVIAHENSLAYGWVWLVAFDDFPCPGGGHWLAEDEDIEPIYDGDTPVSWDACAWRPEVTRA